MTRSCKEAALGAGWSRELSASHVRGFDACRKFPLTFRMVIEGTRGEPCVFQDYDDDLLDNDSMSILKQGAAPGAPSYSDLGPPGRLLSICTVPSHRKFLLRLCVCTASGSTSCITTGAGEPGELSTHPDSTAFVSAVQSREFSSSTYSRKTQC